MYACVVRGSLLIALFALVFPLDASAAGPAEDRANFLKALKRRNDAVGRVAAGQVKASTIPAASGSAPARLGAQGQTVSAKSISTKADPYATELAQLYNQDRQINDGLAWLRRQLGGRPWQTSSFKAIVIRAMTQLASNQSREQVLLQLQKTAALQSRLAALTTREGTLQGQLTRIEQNLTRNPKNQELLRLEGLIQRQLTTTQRTEQQVERQLGTPFQPRSASNPFGL